VLLKAYNIPHQKISEIVGVCENTVRIYLNLYNEHRVEGITKLSFHKPESELVEFSDMIKKNLTEKPPATIKEICNRIKELTGIDRKVTQVAKFIKALGLKRRQVGTIPSKADAEKQEEFKKTKLEVVLEKALQGLIKVYFVDAAHFVHAPFVGFLWSLERLFVKSASGRKRFNVLGALDAATNELIMVTNEAYINAQCVCELMRKLTTGTTVPVTLILDNARYQKCILVAEMALLLNISSPSYERM
jgi:transposase